VSILPDHEIERLCVDRSSDPFPPLIDPYKREQLQPASYDVRLANEFRVFDLNDIRAVVLSDPSTFKDLTNIRYVEDGEEFVLHPGEFALGSTVEVVTVPPDLVARIEGKSSLGRLALSIHETAGFIDPGFNGAVTLEMTNKLRIPIVLEPGQLIAQLAFERLESPARQPYQGRYQGDKSVAPSRFGVTPVTNPDGVKPETNIEWTDRSSSDPVEDLKHGAEVVAREPLRHIPRRV
jgi:dCTP deaminase